jgi:hypothetical protein
VEEGGRAAERVGRGQAQAVADEARVVDDVAAGRGSVFISLGMDGVVVWRLTGG